MEYTVRSLSSDQSLETVAAHVFARAYRAAWRSRYGDDPVGRHVLADLDLLIEYFEAPRGPLH